MRVLATSVLAFQALVLLLAIPVFSVTGRLGIGPAAALGGGLALACVAAIVLLRSRAGYVLGSVVQVAAVVTALWAWPMAVLGPLFGLLWVVALRVGRGR
ncbi:MAG TPA: DUF4233 domain-containing protein [Mycobacteriales bacterium]|nr:DUF4233 domain-containing protein [Mycobacteriales bacterium]